MAARTTALIAAVLILTGCASTRTVWSRDGASDMDFRRDRYECGRENTWAAGGSGLPGALAIAEQAESCSLTQRFLEGRLAKRLAAARA